MTTHRDGCGKRWASTFGWAGVLLSLLVIGCRKAEPPQPARAKLGVTVEMVDGKAFDDILKRQRGNVVLVDCWATWCQPCVKLMPHTVELDRKYGGQGLVVLGLSLDGPEEESAVLAVLKRVGATYPNYLSRNGASPEAIDAFHLPNGALPVVQLLDRQGKVAKTFGGGEPVDPEAVRKAVEDLLKTGS